MGPRIGLDEGGLKGEITLERLYISRRTVEPPSGTVLAGLVFTISMQETTTIGPYDSQRDMLSGQSLFALLALVGTKRMDMESLRERTKLPPFAFGTLLRWLQRECLVDVVSNLRGDEVEERVELTEKGEAALVSMLENTFELPEFR